MVDVNCLGSQKDVASNWESSHSLVEDASLWGRDCSSPLPSGSACNRGRLLHASLSASGCGEGPIHNWIALLLWYLLNPLFCEQVRLCIKVFRGKVLSLSFFLFGDPQFGLLSHVSSLRLSSGHSGLVLTLSTDYAAGASLPSPCSLVSDASLWATFPLATVVKCEFCEFFFFVLSRVCVAL